MDVLFHVFEYKWNVGLFKKKKKGGGDYAHMSMMRVIVEYVFFSC